MTMLNQHREEHSLFPFLRITEWWKRCDDAELTQNGYGFRLINKVIIQDAKELMILNDFSQSRDDER